MSLSAELQIIQFIHEFRNPIFDAFFKFLNLFDRPAFFFVLIPAFWFGKDWKMGFRLTYLVMLSVMTNHALKEFFQSPRPFHLDPTLQVLPIGGYGFPSGAAQTVALLSGLMLSYWKNSWKWCIAFLYIFLISFSRIYLGVHFFTDILGGWALGLFFWALYVYVRPPLERQLEKWRTFPLFLLSQTVPPLLLLWQHFPSAIRLAACAMGMAVGLFINRLRHKKLSAPKTTKECLVRAALGVLGTFSLYFLFSAFSLPCPLFTVFFLVGLGLATGSQLFERRKKCAK